MRLHNRYITIRDMFDMTAKDFAEMFYEFSQLSKSEQNALIRDEYYEWND